MLSPEGKIRYAVVGAGWISQGAFMPGVGQTTNSELAAVVTSDPGKIEGLGKLYGIKGYAYEAYDTLLNSGSIDAVYIATPNFRHREFAEPALKAGIHVLLEKPMASSLDDAEAIQTAAKASGAKLMIRLPPALRAGHARHHGPRPKGRDRTAALFHLDLLADRQGHQSSRPAAATGPVRCRTWAPIRSTRHAISSRPSRFR